MTIEVREMQMTAEAAEAVRALVASPAHTIDLEVPQMEVEGRWVVAMTGMKRGQK